MMRGESNPGSLGSPEVLLCIEPEPLNVYVIRRAMELAHQFGVELRVRLLVDRNVERAARLPLTRLIGLESGCRAEFSPQLMESRRRRALEELEGSLMREGRSLGVLCRMELSGEKLEGTGARWIVFGQPGMLGAVSLPGTPREVVFLPQELRSHGAHRITALVSLIPLRCEHLEWAAVVAAQTGWKDALMVFANQPLRCEREAGDRVPVAGFRPLPGPPFTAPALLRWIGRHGATAALILLRKDAQPGWDEWAVQIGRLAEIPVIFLREAGGPA